MFAIIAAILFAVAAILRLTDASGVDLSLFLYGGLFFLALHLVWPVIVWNRQQ